MDVFAGHFCGPLDTPTGFVEVFFSQLSRYFKKSRCLNPGVTADVTRCHKSKAAPRW
jgi:hypothetical protein